MRRGTRVRSIDETPFGVVARHSYAILLAMEWLWIASAIFYRRRYAERAWPTGSDDFSESTAVLSSAGFPSPPDFERACRGRRGLRRLEVKRQVHELSALCLSTVPDVIRPSSTETVAPHPARVVTTISPFISGGIRRRHHAGISQRIVRCSSRWHYRRSVPSSCVAADFAETFRPAEKSMRLSTETKAARPVRMMTPRIEPGAEDIGPARVTKSAASWQSDTYPPMRQAPPILKALQTRILRRGGGNSLTATELGYLLARFLIAIG